MSTGKFKHQAREVSMHICVNYPHDPVRYPSRWSYFPYHPTAIPEQFLRVLTALRNLSNANIRPNNNNPHLTIVNNQKFNPMFVDCIGAVDVATFSANRDGMAPAAVHCMFALDFDLLFTFFKSDCEGSAQDEGVFLNIVSNPEGNFPVPRDGQFYIVYSRFPLRSGYIPPYGGVRQRFKSTGLPPQDDQELFNSRHSHILNKIKRIFSSFTGRFRILHNVPASLFEFRADIPVACAAIHNFIRVNDPDDLRFRNEPPCSVAP